MRTAALLLAALGAAVISALLLLDDRAGPGPGAGLPSSPADPAANSDMPAAPEASMLVGSGSGPVPPDAATDYADADLGEALGALRFQPPKVPAAAVARLRALCAADRSVIEHLVRVTLGLEDYARDSLPADYPYNARAAADWAVQALPREAAPVLATLFEEVRDDGRQRYAILNLLASFGADAEAAVPILLEALAAEDLSPPLGPYVIGTLAAIGRAAAAATPRLLAWAGDVGHPLHGAAVEHLYALAGMVPEVERSYAGILEGGEHDDRERAFRVVLFQMEEDAEGLRPVFVRLLDDPHPDIRTWAAMALGQIGVRSEVVVERLGRMAEEERSEAETAALGALRSAGARGQQELLTVAQRAEYYETAVNALYHLGHTGYPVRDHPDLLLSLLGDAESGVRGSLAGLLARVDPGPRAADFLPFLRNQVRDPESPLRVASLSIAANLEADGSGDGLDLLLEALTLDALRPHVYEYLVGRPADAGRIVRALEPYVREPAAMDVLCRLAYGHAEARALLRRLAATADHPLPRVRAQEVLDDLDRASASR